MSGQSHAAVLFLIVILMIGVAVLTRTGDRLARPTRSDAWVCSSNTDSLGCFLASLGR